MSDGRAITEVCRKAGVVLALGYQRRRESHFRWVKQQIDAGVFGKLVNAEANISRDRLGKIDLSSWRYQAAGMPGGVMLQIGIHYTDVLDLPDRADQGGARTVRAARAARRQSGRREPDPGARERRALDAQRELRLGVGILPDEHLRQGRQRLLRHAQRAARCSSAARTSRSRCRCANNDAFVEELEEFAAACAAVDSPEVGGDYATTSLAVVRAGILSAREGRRVEVAEILKND